MKGLKTTAQIASEYQVHVTQVNAWKKQLLQNADHLFERGGKKSEPTPEELTAPLYEEIGRLKMGLQWLEKKALSLSVSHRQAWIDPTEDLSVRYQCELAGLSRTFLYYTPKEPSEFDAMIETGSTVPEPSSLVLLAAGAVGVCGMRRRESNNTFTRIGINKRVKMCSRPNALK